MLIFSYYSLQAMAERDAREARSHDTLLLLDVTPLSLGVEVGKALMSVIIPRNSTIPTRRSRLYTTALHEQTHVDVHVYEGQRCLTEHNQQLGLLTLSDVTPLARRVAKIRITFSIDACGMLEVKVEDLTSGAENTHLFNRRQDLTAAKLEEIINESDEYEEIDERRKRELEQALFRRLDCLADPSTCTLLLYAEISKYCSLGLVYFTLHIYQLQKMAVCKCVYMYVYM